MLPSYFDYILVHLRQKARLRPELSPKFSSALGPAQLSTLVGTVYTWRPIPTRYMLYFFSTRRICTLSNSKHAKRIVKIQQQYRKRGSRKAAI